MTTLPLVTFADPEKLTIDHITSSYTSRGETYKPGSVSPRFPASSASYHVQVELENSDRVNVREDSQVRIVCWAPEGKRDDVKQLAALTAGLCAQHPRIRVLTGRSNVSSDLATKRLMCWFLVAVKPAATQHPSE